MSEPRTRSRCFAASTNGSPTSPVVSARRTPRSSASAATRTARTGSGRPLDEYEDVRANGAQFLMVEQHADLKIERVTDRNSRFALVEKVKPLVRQTVQRLNPRAASV